MREELARLVHGVVEQGLALREALAAGRPLVLQAEQERLVALLLTDDEAARLADFGGGPVASGNGRAEAPAAFLGARYALACWLDELFILDSPWSERWNEHKLEVRLYGGNDRAWKFWDQARLAGDRPGADALEVYFLCVMLGFSGELIDAPEQLGGWAAATRERLGRSRGGHWRPPPEREPGTHVAPLAGRGRLRRMLVAASAVLLAVVPVVAFVLAWRSG